MIYGVFALTPTFILERAKPSKDGDAKPRAYRDQGRQGCRAAEGVESGETTVHPATYGERTPPVVVPIRGRNGFRYAEGCPAFSSA